MPARHIALIGAGLVGTALATQLVKAGYSASLSNSRGPDSLRNKEKETGAQALEISAAIAKADFVFLAVPLRGIPALRPIIQASLPSDAVLVDCGNYYPTRDGRIYELDNGMSDTAWVTQGFTNPIAKAFNNIVAQIIVTSARPKGSRERTTLPVSGSSEQCIRLVMDLVEDVGFDAYNAGNVAESWRYQAGQPAYCTEPTRQQLIVLLTQADRIKGPANRDSVRPIFDRLPSDYPPEVLLRVSRLSAGLDVWKMQSWVAAGRFAITVLQIKLFK